MSYGINDETVEQTAWMEKRMSSITGTNTKTGKPYTEAEKIAICKWSLKKNGMSNEAVSELSMRDELWALEDKIRDAIGDSNGLVDSYMYVADIFDAYVVIAKDGKTYSVPYALSGDDVSVDWTGAVEVERRTVYEPVKADASSTVDGGRRITAGSRTIN